MDCPTPAPAPPPSRPRPVRIYLELAVNGRPLGRVYIVLFPDSFPAGVENLLGLVRGDTYYRRQVGTERRPEWRSQPRTLVGSRLYEMLWGEYLIGGDIYQNRGTSAATVWDDVPFPRDPEGVDYVHDRPYLLSLVPRRCPDTDELLYDSTFMITLTPATDDNTLGCLQSDQVVIGQVTGGIEYLEEINRLIRPILGKRQPEIKIVSCGEI